MSGAHPYDVAMLLAVAAHRTAPSFEAWEALFVGLQRQPALQRFLHGVDAPVRQIVVGRAGTCAAAWTESGKTFVWDLATGRMRFEIPGNAMPDHSCRLLAVASVTGEVDVRPLEAFQTPQWSVTQVPAPVTSWTFDPGATMLAVAHKDGRLLVRNLDDGRVRAELTGAAPAVRYLRFSADGQTLAGLDNQGLVHRWKADTLAAVSEPARCGANVPEIVAISPDLRWCAAGGPGQLVVADLSGTGAQEIDLGTPWILALDFSPDSRTLMAGVQGGPLQFWNLDQARRDGAPTAWSEHRSDVTAAAYAVDGGTIVSAARDRSLIVWQADPPSRLVSEIAQSPTGALSPRMLTRCGSRPAPGPAIWSLTAIGPGAATGATVVTNIGKPVTALALRKSGEIFAGAADGDMIATNATSERRAFSTAPGSPIVRIRFNQDESRAAAIAENGAVTLWDVATRTMLATFAGGRPRKGRAGGITPGVDVAFEPGGARMVSVHGDQQAFLWDWGAGTARFSAFPFRPSSYFTSAAFGAGGKTIALGTGIYEGEVVLVDTAQPAAPVNRLPGHDLQDVTGLAFSPDGRLLFSGGFDGRVVVWDVAGRRRIGDAHRTRGSVADLAYAANGAAVTAILERGAVLRWDLDPGHWVEIACRIANRALSTEERARFIDGAGGPAACP